MQKPIYTKTNQLFRMSCGFDISGNNLDINDDLGELLLMFCFMMSDQNDGKKLS